MPGGISSLPSIPRAIYMLPSWAAVLCTPHTGHGGPACTPSPVPVSVFLLPVIGPRAYLLSCLLGSTQPRVHLSVSKRGQLCLPSRCLWRPRSLNWILFCMLSGLLTGSVTDKSSGRQTAASTPGLAAALFEQVSHCAQLLRGDPSPAFGSVFLASGVKPSDI